MTTRKTILGAILVGLIGFLIAQTLQASRPNKNLPHMVDTEAGPTLVLPDALEAYLAAEFPGSRLPKRSEFNPEMLSYYFSRLIGVHPAVAWGDFNGDKRQDYILLLITAESKWGPVVDLVVLNGESRRGQFTSIRLGEIYNFKDDYVSFVEGKLYKGRFKRGGWYINWDKKSKSYNVHKS